MVAEEPKNEQGLCKAVLCLIADRRGERIIKAEQVDAVVRDRPAVEWVFDTPTARFAVEHTRIEIFAQLLDPLGKELAGKLPGAFFLMVEVRAARVPRARHAGVRRAISEWILAKGAALDPEEQTGPSGNCDITETPLGVAFEVTLHRDSDYDSRLFIMQIQPGDLQSLRRDRIRESLSRKCPKLVQVQKEGRVSVLILESDDTALGNRVAIAEATVAELSARNDAPDMVIWARTSTQPWKSWFIKEGTILYPEITTAGPFVLGPTCGAAKERLRPTAAEDCTNRE